MTDITAPIILLYQFFSRIFFVLNEHSFDLFGYSVSIVDIVVSFILLSAVIAVFWKGAKG